MAVRSAVALFFAGLALCQSAAAAGPLGSDVRAFVAANDRAILAELTELLSHRNVATDLADIGRNAQLLVRMLERRGIEARLLEGAPNSAPAVYGELNSPGAARTVVFYGHYDGQPAPTAGWRSDPWDPIVRTGPHPSSPAAELNGRAPIDPEWRLFARSAADDKSPILALLVALDALRASGRTPSVNIKFFFEGEEEQGSPNLPRLLQNHRDLLRADLWLFADGSIHPSGRHQLYFGVRGAMGLELTVYGPIAPLHSGHYGNWAPNPAVALAHLIAAMRDVEGRILIPDFYDSVQPPTTNERAAMAQMPDVETQLRAAYAIGRTEGSERLQDSIARPALNIRGIQAGSVGAASTNAVPSSARASFDFRLVPNQSPAAVRAQVERFLAAQGWLIVREEPNADILKSNLRVIRVEWAGGYAAVRTEMGSPAAQAVSRTVARAIGDDPLLIPMLGGSLPLSTFMAATGTSFIGVPIVNSDNNQHAPNENIRLGNLWDGIVIYAHLMGDLTW